MEKLLIHACCAPCLSYPLELLNNEYNITVLFSNSNIAPVEEYNKRLENVKKLCDIYNVELVIDDYKHKDWLDYVKGLEYEKEGAKRCIKCFHYRFLKLFEYASKNDFKSVTSTLTVSPYKKSDIIFNIARGLSKKYSSVDYLEYNFQKQSGYLKSVQFSQKYDLYRQHYCGCEF